MKHLFLFILLSSTALAQTHVYGGRIHSARWTKDGSPYRVYSTVTIDSLLVIEPGVRVEFASKRDGSHAIIENDSLGRIYAVGSDTDSILFTSYYDDYGWGWLGNSEGAKNQNTFKFCVFDMAYAAVWATSEDPENPDTVSHCSFRNNTTGIQASARSIYISDCVFEGNNTPVEYFDYGNRTGSRVLIERTRIQDNVGGVFIYGKGAQAVIRGCSIFSNTEGVTIISAREVVIGGAPEYCNRIYNNTYNGKSSNILKADSISHLIASYNYWGSVQPDEIESTFQQKYPGYITYRPFTDEHCNPVPVSVQPPPAPAVAKLQVYPNPARQGAPVEIAYTLDRPTIATLAFHDALGREVYREFIHAERAGTHTHTVATSGFRPGLYIYTLLPGEGSPLTGRFIVR